ncbi:MAG: hypothetical protein KatS3mg125_0820 [Lysobacterales bacterium]|nr:MAG: hypothetical protein KatS3mg125_0820 [Xanthomonadales bacterium]
MQTSIEQAMALVVVGNRVLRGELDPDPRRLCAYSNGLLGREHRPTFVEPVAKSGSFRQSPYATSSAGWLRRLRAEGVKALALRHGARRASAQAAMEPPAQVRSAFAEGAEDWWIEAWRGDSRDAWLPRWRLGRARRGEGRAQRWRIVYTRIPLAPEKPPRSGPEEIEALRAALLAHLPEIGEFAFRRRLESFGECFEAAWERLQRPIPDPSAFTSPTEIESLLPEDAVRLLKAARIAWVFGGMHSWNDLGFAGEAGERYEALSARLHALLTAAITAAVNASLRQAPL